MSEHVSIEKTMHHDWFVGWCDVCTTGIGGGKLAVDNWVYFHLTVRHPEDAAPHPKATP